MAENTYRFSGGQIPTANISGAANSINQIFDVYNKRKALELQAIDRATNNQFKKEDQLYKDKVYDANQAQINIENLRADAKVNLAAKQRQDFKDILNTTAKEGEVPLTQQQEDAQVKVSKAFDAGFAKLVDGGLSPEQAGIAMQAEADQLGKVRKDGTVFESGVLDRLSRPTVEQNLNAKYDAALKAGDMKALQALTTHIAPQVKAGVTAQNAPETARKAKIDADYKDQVAAVKKGISSKSKKSDYSSLMPEGVTTEYIDSKFSWGAKDRAYAYDTVLKSLDIKDPQRAAALQSAHNEGIMNMGDISDRVISDLPIESQEMYKTLLDGGVEAQAILASVGKTKFSSKDSTNQIKRAQRERDIQLSKVPSYNRYDDSVAVAQAQLADQSLMQSRVPATGTDNYNQTKALVDNIGTFSGTPIELPQIPTNQTTVPLGSTPISATNYQANETLDGFSGAVGSAYNNLKDFLTPKTRTFNEQQQQAEAFKVYNKSIVDLRKSLSTVKTKKEVDAIEAKLALIQGETKETSLMQQLSNKQAGREMITQDEINKARNKLN